MINMIGITISRRNDFNCLKDTNHRFTNKAPKCSQNKFNTPVSDLSAIEYSSESSSSDLFRDLLERFDSPSLLSFCSSSFEKLIDLFDSFLLISSSLPTLKKTSSRVVTPTPYDFILNDCKELSKSVKKFSNLSDSF